MSIKDFSLSDYGAASWKPSPVNRMMASFAVDFRDGVDSNLGVGYVNENTIPSGLILEAVQQVLAQPDTYRLPFNYGGPEGSVNLIASIRKYHLQNRIGGLTAEVLDRLRIIIGPSGATSLLEGAAHVLRRGIVVTSDPMYYIYCNCLERLGFDVFTVAEDTDGMRPDLLQEKLSALGPRKNEISFFYIVTVNNPTGSILSNKRRQAIVVIAEELSRELGRKIPVIFDKAYEDLVHDVTVEPLQSPLLFDRLGQVFEVGTLSKILSPALRIGYMTGPAGPFLDAMVQKTSDVGFSAPLISQEAASWLLDHHVGRQVEKVRQGYREKAAAVRGWIDEELEPYLSACCGGRAGFYFYVTFKNIETAEGSPFYTFLARTTGDPDIDGPPDNKKPRVIYVPGEFCVHPQGDLVEAGRRQLRLSFGFEELARIRQAIVYMRQAAEFALAKTQARSP
ncbi:MAG: pyridoxal phosphate-dependent aminotransferase [Deltaproteobacteria bacterium]|nr:pyridoxal phosphate-dependent aminotransferase [Deltaproteobacteria bacterium]